jgi:hippurate hydrolase
MPLGSFGIRPGPFFAAADLVRIEVEGRGGHAAKPHETVDATLVAAHIVTALQSIASRNADPTEQVVVSITSFRTSSDAYNVIPQKVELRGTVRSLNTGLQDMAEANLTRIAENTAAAFGAMARVSYKRNYPVMVNAEAQTDFAAEVARAVAGDCAEAPLVMGAEDFSFMLNARPGAYILVGNGDTASVHHPEYDFDDAVIPAGCSWWAEVVERRMPVG